MATRAFSRHTDPVRDPVLDETLVLGYARRHLPELASVTEVDETGGEARAYVIDEKYVFKTQRPHRVRASTSLKKENYFLNLIAREAPAISVPRVLGYGSDGELEYTLMTRMPGTAFRNLTLPYESRRSVVFELGRTLGQLHRLPLAPFEESGLFPGDKDLTEIRTRIEGGLRRGVEGIANSQEGWEWNVSPEALVGRVMEMVRNDARAALHANPGPEHVFVDPVTLKFQGIIDFADAYISHPAFDTRRWSSPTDRAALLEGYQAFGEVDGSTWTAIQISGLMATIANWPERRQQALVDLRIWLSHIFLAGA